MSARFSAGGRAIAELWRDEFRKAVEAMADIHAELELNLSGHPPSGGLLWWKQSFDLGAGTVLWVGVAERAWTHLGQQTLTAAGIPSAAPDEVRNTFLELLRQSLGSLAAHLGAQAGREVAATEGEEEQPPVGAAEELRFTLHAAETQLPDVSFWISHALLDALAPRTDGRAGDRPAETAGAASETQPGSTHGPLELLLDVEMPVSVSFGRTQLRLQDVLKLISGSIIELDRAVAEPVEVVVNNCVIARGEVVVVEGNYGVRINEIISRADRLQQSRRYMLPAHGHRI